MKHGSGKYVVILAAYNEAECIHHAIDSLLAQTVRPVGGIVVDDGSTDATCSVVDRYSKTAPWIHSYRRGRVSGQAYFASNVAAIMEGVRLAQDLEFEFLAILDADISLPPDYYESIIARFQDDSKLGIASGIYQNLIDGRLHDVLHDRRSSPKAIMVFRRPCFEEIGGFVPLPWGGEDTLACAMARMKGWKTWSFPDIKVVHHRPTGLGNAGSLLKARFRQGLADYGVGSHPLFVLAKALRRCVREKPYLAGGVLRLAGFIYGYVAENGRETPGDAVRFLRQEQLGRLLRGNRIPDEYAEQLGHLCKRGL